MFPDLWAFKNYADAAYLQKMCYFLFLMLFYSSKQHPIGLLFNLSVSTTDKVVIQNLKILALRRHGAINSLEIRKGAIFSNICGLISRDFWQ